MGRLQFWLLLTPIIVRATITSLYTLTHILIGNQILYSICGLCCVVQDFIKYRFGVVSSTSR